MTKAWSRALLYPLSMFLISNGQKISWSKNVSQILFDGSDNPLLKMGTYIPGYRGPDKFAWFYKVIIEEFLKVHLSQKTLFNFSFPFHSEMERRSSTTLI